jgi:hypothetical protein
MSKQDAIAQLRKWISPGDTVYTILRHVSASGMTRDIGIVLLKKDEKGNSYFLHPNYAVAEALGYGRSPRGADGVRVGGCGMDMGFQIVYSLGAVLWPNGTPKPHGRRNGEPDSTGGYALKHQWL